MTKLTPRQLAERRAGLDGMPGLTYRAGRDSYRLVFTIRPGELSPEQTFRGSDKAAAVRAWADLASGRAPETPKRPTAKSRELTVYDYALRYLDDRDDVKPQTVRAYKTKTNRFLATSDFGRLPLVSVTRTDVSAFLKWAARQEDERMHRPLSFGSIDNLRHFISGLLRAAAEERLIAPVLIPKTPRTRGGGELLKPTAEVEVATPAERDAFLKALDGEQTATLWHLLDGSGMRIGEALALRWQYVDLDAGTVRIVGTLDDHTRVIGAPKSARSSRQIQLRPDLVERLKAHRQQQAQAFGDLPLSFERFVFTTRAGVPYYGTNVRKAFDRIVESSGVGASRRARGIAEKMTPHDLRHGFVTRMLARPGVTTMTVAQYVGDTERMIAKTYAHYVPGASDALTQALAEDSA